MYSASRDGKTYVNNTEGLKKAGQIALTIEGDRKEYNKHGRDTQKVLNQARTYVGIYGHRSFWPYVQGLVSRALAHAQTTTKNHRSLLISRDGLKKLKEIPRNERHLIFIESMTSQYFSNLSEASPEEGAGSARDADPSGTRLRPNLPKPAAATASLGRGFRIVLKVRTPMKEGAAAAKLMHPLVIFIRDNEKNNDRKHVLNVASAKWTLQKDPTKAKGGRKVPKQSRPRPQDPGRTEGDQDQGPEKPSPLFPDEDTVNDARFTITLMIEIVGDGTKPNVVKTTGP